MKRFLKTLSLVLIIVLGVSAFVACQPPDDPITEPPTGESAIAFDGTSGSSATVVNAAVLAETYGYTVAAEYFVSASAAVYSDVQASAAGAYLNKYSASDSGWALLSTDPRVYSKNNTAVLIYYSNGSLAIVTCILKEGGVAALANAAVTYTYAISNPTKTEYVIGENLDLTGFAVNRTGSNSSSKALVADIDYTIDTTSYDKDTVGSYTFPVRIIGIAGTIGNVSVSVVSDTTLVGGSASPLSTVYTDGIEAKLSVTLPTNASDATVSYSTKTVLEGEFGEWTADEPVLYAVGRIYVQIKFSKTGYNPKVIGADGNLYIEITEGSFENQSLMTIDNQSEEYDGNAKTASYSFTIPNGAAISFSRDNKATWLSSQPSFTEAGEYTVYFKVEKANYTTVEGNYTVTISKAEIEGLSANNFAYIFKPGQNTDGEYLSMIKGTIASDVISYSTDGVSYSSQHPDSSLQGSQIYTKIERGANHQKIFTQQLVSANQYNEISFSPSCTVENAEGDMVYLNLSATNWDNIRVLVRISWDDGDTYGEWRDYKNDNPYFEKFETAEYKVELLIISSGIGVQSYVYDLSLPIKDISGVDVKTAPAKLRYVLGDTLNLTGLVLTVTYDDESYADFGYNALPAGVSLSLAHGAVLSSRAATGVAFEITCGDLDPASFTYYVYDLEQDLEFEEGTELSFYALPAKSDYEPNSDIDLTGLVVHATFPTVFGEGNFVVLPASRYSTDAASVDMSESGPALITVTGLTVDGIDSDKTATLGIFVDYPFKGTTWYGSEGPADYLTVVFLDNQNALYYSNSEDGPAVPINATYTAIYYTEAEGYEIAVTFEYAPDEFTIHYFLYSPSEQRLYAGEDYFLTALLDTDVVLWVKLSFSETEFIYFNIIAPEGLIPEETAEILLSYYGDLYFSESGDSSDLVPDSYLFTESTNIYCYFFQEDFTDAPFLGYWECETEDGYDLFLIAPKYFGVGTSRFNYRAEENEDTWTIMSVALGATLVYDKTAGTLEVYSDDILFATYTRVDDEIYAIVFIDTLDEDLTGYCALYKVTIGDAFPNIQYKDGWLLKLSFDGYAGEPITANTTLYITAVEGVYIYEDDVLGTFARYFTFDFETMTVTLTEGWNLPVSYGMEVVSIEDEQINLSFDDGAFVGYILYGDLVIESGGLAGTYERRSNCFYEGLVFVDKKFTLEVDEESYSLYFYAGGYFDGRLPDYEGFYGDYTLINIDGEVYYIELNYYDGEAYIALSATYDHSARTLVIGDVTLNGPAAYIGQYSYQDQFVNIYENGNVYGPDIDGQIISAEAEDGITTITIMRWNETEVTIIYNHAADTVTYADTDTYGEVVFARCLEQYRNMSFVRRPYVNGAYELMIDSNGKVHINSTIIGEIAEFNQADGTFTLIYFDGETSPAACTFTATQITVGEVNYTYSDQYAALPFTEVVFYLDIDDTRIRISKGGVLYFNDRIQGYITEVDEEEFTFTVVYYDDLKDNEEGSFVFGEDESIYTSTLTIGDAICRFWSI